MLRKTLCCLLCCISIMCLAATAVFAAAAVPDAARPGSLSFDFSGAKDPAVTSGSLELRMVARWDETIGDFVWCESYGEAGFSLDDISSAQTASMLSLYALTCQLPATEISVGKDGTAKAENLAPGIYLVSQAVPFEGYTCIKPALISVPRLLDGEWVYEVDAAPKLSPLTPEHTESTTEPYKEIPPTGQTNWPIPVLVLVGCFLILLGLCLRKTKNHETET